jgi:hypothetical protein
MLIARPVLGHPSVGKKGIDEDTHTLATWKIESDEERRAARNARLHVGAAARFQCVSNELEEGHLAVTTDGVDLPREGAFRSSGCVAIAHTVMPQALSAFRGHRRGRCRSSSFWQGNLKGPDSANRADSETNDFASRVDAPS